jgi:hypothetical protein
MLNTMIVMPVKLSTIEFDHHSEVSVYATKEYGTSISRVSVPALMEHQWDS